VLDVEDRPGAGGCAAWIIAFIAALFILGVGLIVLLLRAFSRFRRLRFEASSLDTGDICLVVAGYPYEVVVKAVQ
jgi:hypothetical protein